MELTDQDVHEAMKAIPGIWTSLRGLQGALPQRYRHAVERISRSIIAKDIMAKDVISVRREALLHEVAEIMGRRGISGVRWWMPTAGWWSDLGDRFPDSNGASGPKNFMSVVATCLKAKEGITLPIQAQTARTL